MRRVIHARRGLSGRRGLSLLEMAITVAIIGILATMATGLMTQALPSWRTRQAARQFAADLASARARAISENVEYRIRLTAFDSDLAGTSPSVGTYYVERGNRDAGSTTWDILPVDLDGSGTLTGEGTVDISEGGQDELVDVSIEDWTTSDGTIVFSPRGWIENDATDFDSRGYIEVTFVNKAARRRGEIDEWTVVVARGGLVRLEPTAGTPVGNTFGTVVESWASGGAGYTGGSGGGSGRGEDGAAAD
ncbi:MAG: pilus assembly FimT family protein [Myxococcota bacterium]